MKILAIEFSSLQRSVAVLDTTGSGPSAALTEAIESGGRAAKAFELIESVLRQAQLEREQVECLAIGLGPGSYAGIRAAIALAQGWQLASQVRLLGINSAECLAAQAQAEGLSGTVHVVIDAQRNEFYLATYQISRESLREMARLKLASHAEVEKLAKGLGIIAGPEVTKWFPNGKILFPRAAILGQLAAKRSDFVSGEKLEPIYLRETTFVKAPPARILPT